MYLYLKHDARKAAWKFLVGDILLAVNPWVKKKKEDCATMRLWASQSLHHLGHAEEVRARPTRSTE